MTTPTRDAAVLVLPPAIVEQLVDLALKTPAGQVVLTTLLNFSPEVKTAVEQAKGAIKVTCQGATLAAGDPPPPPKEPTAP